MSTELTTNAERRADESRKLPNFKQLSLPGVKQEVANILSLIGKGGIFSTYTIHDITHIDQMLMILEWLIPESTKRKMTPVDWLLTVLAIYLHDLGMVTTTEEYEKRLENAEFSSWHASLDKTDEGREYLARTNRMTADEKERFFFQEFIRKGHAQRIREWVTGRHTRKWGPQVEPIAARIADLLKTLPPRFRDYLGTTCESHHKADLEKIDQYPLAARLGNDPREIVNVQYAAILLRTTDVLHVTKDRSPSVMYQAIKFSDPKSVDEWDKQLGTFAVGMKGRELVESDPETAIIVLNADFTEERPFFALQEYIAYADNEIRQSKRWIDKSQETPDGKDYSFPWHKVDGDVRLEGVPPQSMRFELDRGQLLDLLVGHTIYNEPTVAIRELLQNGIDAVRYQAHLAAREAKAKNEPVPDMGKVTVKWNNAQRQLIIQDNGIGMDRDIIKHHLMNVGSSYYNTSQFEAEHRDFVPISRFGIGILTCFMVSDDVEIITFKDQRGFRIRMTSVKSTYLLRELENGDPLVEGLEPHGTRVTLRLRDTVDLTERSVLDIVRHWVILPECVVEYQEEGQSPVRVGFRSATETLHAVFMSNQPTRARIEEKLEFIIKSRVTTEDLNGHSEGVYELTFAVESGYYPERSFRFIGGVDIPRVCIEGIRVSQSLPGFERASPQFGALLSVRGSRRFRTTVSRAGLEVDAEYLRVAKLCAEMLFEHVADETKRISEKRGKPLSQAASCCMFLKGQLESASSQGYAARYLPQLEDLQPSIVMERIEAQQGQPVTSRELVSPSKIRDTQDFWTIESRSVDSLGTISMDLGREMSLNEFLLALAPEVTQLRYSPMLPKAHISSSAIRKSHKPESVEFSKEHQQTAIKWVQRTASADEYAIAWSEVGSAERQQTIFSTLRNMRDRYRWNVTLGELMTSWIASATIVGDDPKIVGVATRLGPIIRIGTELDEFWKKVRAAAVQIANVGAHDEAICAVTMVEAVVQSLSITREWHEDETGQMLWKQKAPLFRAILAEHKIDVNFPTDLDELVNSNVIFNATRFWRDWDRTMF